MSERKARGGAVVTTPEAVARRIQEALEYRGWTVADLRRRLEESSAKIKGYTALYEYARGEKSPPLDFFEDASRELGVELRWLAFGIGHMTKVHAVANQTIDEAIEALVTGPYASPLLRDGMIQGSLRATLTRKAEIEEVVLRRGDDDLAAVRHDIERRLPGWALALADYVMDPKAGLDWDLADPWDMDEQDWLSCAISRLDGIRQGMPESYRKARILEADRERKAEK